MLLPADKSTLWFALWVAQGALVLLFAVARRPVSPVAIHALVLLVTLLMGGLLLWSIPKPQGFDDITQTFPLICFTGLAHVAPRDAFTDKESKLLSFLVGTVAFFLILAGLTAFNAGGGQWGPRYLLAIVPAITTILISYIAKIRWAAIATLPRTASILLLVVLFTLSLFVQYRGVVELRVQTTMQQEIIRRVAVLRERVVILNWEGTAEVVAPIFYDKIFLLATQPDQVDSLIRLLQEHGFTEFAYVNMLPSRTKEFTLPLDMRGTERCCATLRDQSYIFFVRNLRQQDWYIHLMIQRYQLSGAHKPQSSPAIGELLSR
jgi:hypothetical protein